MGVNGATCVTFTTENKIKEIAALRPDLIILSFGTNEAHSRRYLAPVHEMQIDRLLSMLKKGLPRNRVSFDDSSGSVCRTSPFQSY